MTRQRNHEFTHQYLDRIQNYEKHSKFPNYLTNIHTIYMVNFNNLDITDVPLPNGINELQIQMKLILLQFYHAVDAFKPATFSFACDFLNIYKLSDTLTVRDTIVVDTITTNQLNLLSKYIKEFNTIIDSRNDQLVHIAHFNNKPGPKGPFYVRKNAEIRDKIKMLFAGKTIYLYADVSENSERNAVKFSRVTLNICSHNII